MTLDPQAQTVGPAKRWILHLVLVNPLTYAAALVLAFGVSADLRKFLYSHARELPAVRNGLIHCYRWLAEGWGWSWVIGTLLVVSLASLLICQSHSYRLDDGFVYKRTGLIGTFDDPVALSQIIDVNTAKNLFQRMFGTGDLIIVVVDRPGEARTLRLHYVENADEVRRFILERCGGRRTTFVL